MYLFCNKSSSNNSVIEFTFFPVYLILFHDILTTIYKFKPRDTLIRANIQTVLYQNWFSCCFSSMLAMLKAILISAPWTM